jgi:hypothetical protein
MSRVIHTQSTGKTRNRLMRTCAELLRHLSQKQAVDEETRDMATFLMLCLQEINDGLEESAAVWEKRDYWIKAEKLRQRWHWVSKYADQLETMIRSESWQQLPENLVVLLPHFAEIKVTRLTRSPSLWKDAYKRFISETN